MGRLMDSTQKWAGRSDYVAVSAASAQSAVWPDGIRVVRLVSTTNCHINFGVNPTAAATDNNGIYLPAGVVEYFQVRGGERLAVIRDTADGSLNVAEMTL
jgi:hypothetical protein